MNERELNERNAAGLERVPVGMMRVEAYLRLRSDMAKMGVLLPLPISGGAFVPLAMALIPLIPVGVQWISAIVNAIRDDPGVPDDQTAALNAVAEALAVTNQRVQALPIRQV